MEHNVVDFHPFVFVNIDNDVRGVERAAVVDFIDCYRRISEAFFLVVVFDFFLNITFSSRNSGEIFM